MSGHGEADTAPLVELDRALGPLRRVLRYAMQPGARPRYLEINVGRHVTRALDLDLPGALREELGCVAAALNGFDDASSEEQQQRLSQLYAKLTRLDAVVGLPLPASRLRAVRKPIQRDEPERGAEPDSGDPVAGRGADPGTGRAVARAPAPPSRPRIDETTPIEELAGADLTAALAELGLTSLCDVLNVAPEGHTELTVHGAGRPLPEGPVAVGGRLRSSFTVLQPGGERQAWSWLEGAGVVKVRWAVRLGSPEAGIGQRVVVAGHHRDGVIGDGEIAVPSGSFVRLAQYGLEGVEDRDVRALVSAFATLAPRARDPVSAPLLHKLGLDGRHDAWLGVHTGELSARPRMAFDEALLVQLAGFLGASGTSRGLPHAVVHGFAGTVSQIRELILDDPQQRCLEDIKRDLRSHTPMRRVLSGEVGTGRGRVALMAAAQVAEGRNQVLILADDDVGAAVRFLHTEPLLTEGGIVSKLIQAPPTGSQRDAVRKGEIHVVFGSMELLDHELEFRRLGLVIVHEREAWGRASRWHEALPAPRPDLLVVPTVPVGPRLLLTAFADHDVSELVDAGRRPAEIRLFEAVQRAEAYARLREVVEAGLQAIVVFPTVRGRDALDVRGSQRLVRALEDELLQGLTVGLYHGGVPAEERQRVHDDFEHRRLQVMICTTRVEEGPPLPGASLVVVEQAESMESWRLHRIIGFFSRNTAGAEAILVAGDLASRESVERLERLPQAPSGMALTEYRVATEGIERAVAGGAAPLPSLTWLDLDHDLALVLAARGEARRILQDDPALRRGPHAELARELLSRWGDLWPDADPDLWKQPRLDPSSEGGRRRRRRRRRKR